MSRGRITTVVGVLAALSAALVAAVAGASGSAVPSTITFVAVENAKDEVYVDNGKKGESVGDVFVFTQRLHRGSRSGPVIGRAEITCLATSMRGIRCSGTIFLARGTLEAAGTIIFGDNARFRLPLLGGTKAYAGVRGEVVITETSETTSRYVVTVQS